VKAGWIKKLETRKSMLLHGDVVSVQWEGYGQTEKAYLVSEPLFAHVAEPLADLEIFTSATLVSVAPLLKIPKDCIIAYPEVFDWAANVSVCPLEDNGDGSSKNVPLGAETLEEIYAAPDRPLTVCLFLSKKQAHEAAKGLANKPNVYIQGWGPGQELGELVECIRRSEERAEELDDDIPF
jgi:hypothetical protein